jgi:GNAT superfamily N-acetyltransferase
MQIIFQPAAIPELELLVTFMRRFYESDRYPFDERIAIAALERILADTTLGQVWVITEKETHIGYIVLTLGYSLEYGGRDAFIDEFYIEASHRGRGIGTQAMEFVEEACLELGVNALHLEVERGNKAGQGLYRKQGYEDHDRYLMTKRIKR